MPQQKVPDEKEFDEWLAHPITQLYRNEFLQLWKLSIMKQWSKGTFHGSNPTVSFSANAQALGQLDMLDQLSELDYDKFHEVLKDD